MSLKLKFGIKNFFLSNYISHFIGLAVEWGFFFDESDKIYAFVQCRKDFYHKRTGHHVSVSINRRNESLCVNDFSFGSLQVIVDKVVVEQSVETRHDFVLDVLIYKIDLGEPENSRNVVINVENVCAVVNVPTDYDDSCVAIFSILCLIIVGKLTVHISCVSHITQFIRNLLFQNFIVDNVFEKVMVVFK